MIRCTGALLLFFACSGMGFWKSRQCTGRVHQLKELIKMGYFLKGEISFARTTLPEALGQMGEKVEFPFSEFVRTLSERMKKYSGENFSHTLRAVMEEKLKDTYLETVDLEEFYSAACNLGYLDKEMQIHILDRYLKEQAQKVEMLTVQMPKQQKLFRSLGILGGAFFVILFW